jgi:hypothetical protein
MESKHKESGNMIKIIGRRTMEGPWVSSGSSLDVIRTAVRYGISLETLICDTCPLHVEGYDDDQESHSLEFYASNNEHLQMFSSLINVISQRLCENVFDKGNSCLYHKFDKLVELLDSSISLKRYDEQSVFYKIKDGVLVFEEGKGPDFFVINISNERFQDKINSV